MRYRYMAQFWKGDVKPFEKINQIINEIMLASRRLSHYRIHESRGQISPRHLEKHWERVEETEKIFWEGAEDKDPLIPRINSAIAMIEKKCRSVMKDKVSFWEIIKNWRNRKRQNEK